MAIDNAVYDRMADSWWDEDGFLHALTALNPSRFGYMRRVLCDEMGLRPAGLRALDVGCGGGLLAEEFARLGFDVTGVDPSEKSLEAARRHAGQKGLPIAYRQGMAESLPFDAESFDVVYCCDVLEHVQDLSRVVAETARVLKPGGVYLFDTINRTLRSKLVAIYLMQEWSWTRFMPPDLHDWRMFVRPEELERLLVQNGLVPSAFTGLKPRAGPLRLVRALRRRRRGELSYLEAFREADLGESRDLSVQYIGHARKPSSK